MDARNLMNAMRWKEMLLETYVKHIAQENVIKTRCVVQEELLQTDVKIPMFVWQKGSNLVVQMLGENAMGFAQSNVHPLK